LQPIQNCNTSFAQEALQGFHSRSHSRGFYESGSTMKFYYSPAACSLAVHIVLHETGQAHEAIQSSTKTHQLKDGTDFYRINPLGYVPFLVLDDGQTLREVSAIMQYLAAQAPEKKLVPAHDSMAHWRLQEWLSFISTELHKNFGPLFNPATPEDAKPAARQRVLGRLQWVEGELGSKPYLLGEQFSVADAYLFTVTNWTQFVAVDISGLPQLQAYRERILARPSVQAAMKAEGLLQ